MREKSAKILRKFRENQKNNFAKIFENQKINFEKIKIKNCKNESSRIFLFSKRNAERTARVFRDKKPTSSNRGETA